MQWMNDGMGEGTAELLGVGEFGLFALLPLVVWSLAWKGWALYLAAR